MRIFLERFVLPVLVGVTPAVIAANISSSNGRFRITIGVVLKGCELVRS